MGVTWGGGRDIRYGRRGGRWASPPPSAKDLATLEEWRRQRDALEAAAERAAEEAGEQLDLFAMEEATTC